MLNRATMLVYDNYRMSKQPISVTLSPDNLLWLRGRARAEQLGSLSEFLDQLVTRARFGQNTPRAARSMKGALADFASEPFDAPAIAPHVWDQWQARWDTLLVGVDTTRTGTGRKTVGSRGAATAGTAVKPRSRGPRDA